MHSIDGRFEICVSWATAYKHVYDDQSHPEIYRPILGGASGWEYFCIHLGNATHDGKPLGLILYRISSIDAEKFPRLDALVVQLLGGNSSDDFG